ncbi:MAG: murein peptide amidase A [Gammaproteobacteria bacterium]|nr:murein peptide amidase A [Gammaproteobacteria bacterium]
MSAQVAALLLLVLAAGGAPAQPAATVNAECRRIAQKLASVGHGECLQLDLAVTRGESVQGAPILYREFPPVAERQPRARVLLIGGIHGDEYSSVSIVFKWMNILDTHHSGLFHWRIVPLLNPDGLLRERAWRMNANGVDLNRNFPMPDWENVAPRYWVEQTDRSPRYFPGERALSEPESRWLVDEINGFSPDVIVAVHAPHGVVDYDGPRSGPRKLGRLYLSLLGTFPGSLGNYAGVQRRIPVVTVELPYAGIMPKPGEIGEMWRDLVRWLSNNTPSRQPIAGAKPGQDTDPS